MQLFESEFKRETFVQRTLGNIRKRPNAHKRHNPIEDLEVRGSSFNFFSKDDLEFLSLNYRKERASRISSSKRRIIFIMFQQEIPYFPTLREIRDELILAQLYELS